MPGEIAKGQSMAAALRRFHDESNGRLEIMTLTYDLDGALDAGQLGMARYAATSLLDASVAQWLREHGIEVTAFGQSPARARICLAMLAAVDADLAGRVSALYGAVLPLEAEPVHAHCRRVIQSVGHLLGDGAGGLSAAVAGWADRAQALRAMCDRLGVPLNDFYWAPPSEKTWYSDVMRYAAEATPMAAPAKAGMP